MFEAKAGTHPCEAQMGHYSKGRLQPWIHFHPSLTFEGKAGAHPCEAPHGTAHKGSAPSLVCKY